MKFTELNEKAQLVAIKDYIAGWEDEKEETKTLAEGREGCIDTNDDVNYYSDGTFPTLKEAIEYAEEMVDEEDD